MRDIKERHILPGAFRRLFTFTSGVTGTENLPSIEKQFQNALNKKDKAIKKAYRNYANALTKANLDPKQIKSAQDTFYTTTASIVQKLFQNNVNAKFKTSSQDATLDDEANMQLFNIRKILFDKLAQHHIDPFNLYNHTQFDSLPNARTHYKLFAQFKPKSPLCYQIQAAKTPKDLQKVIVESIADAINRSITSTLQTAERNLKQKKINNTEHEKVVFRCICESIEDIRVILQTINDEALLRFIDNDQIARTNLEQVIKQNPNFNRELHKGLKNKLSEFASVLQTTLKERFTKQTDLESYFAQNKAIVPSSITLDVLKSVWLDANVMPVEPRIAKITRAVTLSTAALHAKQKELDKVVNDVIEKACDTISNLIDDCDALNGYGYNQENINDNKQAILETVEKCINALKLDEIRISHKKNDQNTENFLALNFKIIAQRVSEMFEFVGEANNSEESQLTDNIIKEFCKAFDKCKQEYSILPPSIPAISEGQRAVLLQSSSPHIRRTLSTVHHAPALPPRPTKAAAHTHRADTFTSGVRPQLPSGKKPSDDAIDLNTLAWRKYVAAAQNQGRGVA